MAHKNSAFIDKLIKIIPIKTSVNHAPATFLISCDKINVLISVHPPYHVIYLFCSATFCSLSLALSTYLTYRFKVSLILQPLFVLYTICLPTNTFSYVHHIRCYHYNNVYVLQDFNESNKKYLLVMRHLQSKQILRCNLDVLQERKHAIHTHQQTLPHLNHKHRRNGYIHFSTRNYSPN